ncbi:hypothetical protein ACRALDRAFT_207593 [Sodiomyces alcalophilus JCM 7366]|uniref:uncharacterized protein n=1 Tax=Sodiomyces alcalophilus JCM 7366 TaxID=591952 RepID=UPI0039B65A16
MTFDTLTAYHHAAICWHGNPGGTLHWAVLPLTPVTGSLGGSGVQFCDWYIIPHPTSHAKESSISTYMEKKSSDS